MALIRGWLLFPLTHDLCSDYSRAATISANSQSLQRLFEGGYYSKCGVYSRKYDVFSWFFVNNFIRVLLLCYLSLSFPHSSVSPSSPHVNSWKPLTEHTTSEEVLRNVEREMHTYKLHMYSNLTNALSCAECAVAMCSASRFMYYFQVIT